jgi:hypothetical protein
MKRYLFALAAVVIVASAADAQRPDPNRPFTVVSGYDPYTGGYANTQYFTDSFTGLPVERGYGYGPTWVPTPAYYPGPAVWYPPPPPVWSGYRVRPRWRW